jgi:hypothetical protein
MILVIDNYDSFVFNIARYVEELGREAKVERNDRIGVEDILAAGALETERIATVLLEVKRAYESSDTSQRDAYVGLWEYVE